MVDGTPTISELERRTASLEAVNLTQNAAIIEESKHAGEQDVLLGNIQQLLTEQRGDIKLLLRTGGRNP